MNVEFYYPNSDRLQHLTPQENLASKHPESETMINPRLSFYRDFLRSCYEIEVSSSFTQWPPIPTTKVIKLAMIKKEKIQRGRIDDEFVRMSITGKVDDILHSKTPVDLENIISEREKIRNLILIEGAPGSGKSTLSLHICQEWGKGQLFQQYDVVILVKLRDPLVQTAKCVADLLPCVDNAMTDQVEEEIKSNYGKGMLWVLDGWDELPSDLPQDSIIHKLIKPSMSRKYPIHRCDVIVTSRPVSSAKLHPLVSARVEVLGFTPDELKQYFTECLKGDSKAVQSLLDKIRENPVVEGSCYLPLNAAIVAHTYLAGDHTLPTTVHGIFSSVVQCSLQRYLQDRLGKTAVIESITSLEGLPSELHTQFTHLCKLAFCGIKNNKVTFTARDLVCLCIPPDICEVGLLQAVPSVLSVVREVYYCFLHLSIQELLAAVHTSHISSSEQISEFQKLFGQPRFSAVFQFYAGITKLRTKRQFLSKLPRFLCPVPASVHDLVRKIICQEQKKDSKPLLVSLLHCLYEAEDPSLCQFVAEQLYGWLNLFGTTLNPLDCLSIGYFIYATTSGTFRVSLSSCSISDQAAKFLFLGVCKYINTHSTVTTQLSMEMSHNDIHEEGVHHIAKLLTDTNAVTTQLDMDLSYNDIHEEGAHHIAKLLTNTNEVHTLDLSRNGVGAEGLKSLCGALVTNTSLTELVLYNCSIVVSEDNGPVLTEMLRRNNTLKVLDLGWNSVTESACHYIATGLKNNTSLRELDLSHCTLTDRGVESLSTGLNDYIEVLRLNGYKEITISGLKTLASHLITPARLRKVVISHCLKYSINSVFGRVNELRMRKGLPKIVVQGEWLLYVFVCTLYTDDHSTLYHSTIVVVQQCTFIVY